MMNCPECGGDDLAHLGTSEIGESVCRDCGWSDLEPSSYPDDHPGWLRLSVEVLSGATIDLTGDGPRVEL